MQRVKGFITKHRFQIGAVGKGVGIGRHRVHSRLTGLTAWTAPEVVRFHSYLAGEGVTVDLGELTRMCAADHGSE